MPWGQEGEQARLALRAIELRYLLLPTGLAITVWSAPVSYSAMR